MNIAFVWMRALVRFLVVSCHFPQNCVRWRRGFSLPAERGPQLDSGLRVAAKEAIVKQHLSSGQMSTWMCECGPQRSGKKCFRGCFVTPSKAVPTQIYDILLMGFADGAVPSDNSGTLRHIQ